jgi:hypothetical protein
MNVYYEKGGRSDILLLVSARRQLARAFRREPHFETDPDPR